jgi:hypothetical protein
VLHLLLSILCDVFFVGQGFRESEYYRAPAYFYVPLHCDASDTKVLIVNKKGLWIAKGITDEKVVAEPRPRWSMNWNSPVMPSNGTDPLPQKFSEQEGYLLAIVSQACMVKQKKSTWHCSEPRSVAGFRVCKFRK